MPSTYELDAAQRRVAEEAESYLGGMVARSASRNGALLARYRAVLRELLGFALERAGAMLADEDSGGAWSVLEVLQESIVGVLRAGLAEARAIAGAEVLMELNTLAPNLSIVEQSQAGNEEKDDFEHIQQLITRFIKDLRNMIARRFQIAELMGEDAETAAESLTEDNIAGRAVQRHFDYRLWTVLKTEWVLASNEERWITLLRAKKYLPDLKTKYIYFDHADCDGSCVLWATGGDEEEEGVYELYEAPMPVRDTHPHCHCILVPWLPGKGTTYIPFLESENPGLVFLENVGEGFLDSINPLEIWRGLKATGRSICGSRSIWSALGQLGKGAGIGIWESLRDAVVFGDPRKQGKAIGALIPDILLSFVGGIGGVKAGAKGVTAAGKGAKIAGRLGRALQKTEKAAKVAEDAAARAKKLAAHTLGSAGERKLAEWLEQRGRKLVLDPRNKALTAKGADAITVSWKEGKCVVEFWDNKAWTKSRTVSGSSALERIEGRLPDTLKDALEKGNLSAIEQQNILKAIRDENVVYKRIVSNAGGKARPGATLEKMGIFFEKID